ncbi:MAG: universal stress protein, partial [Bacteroidota bacterium]
MKNILVPIDFSEHSEYALEVAAIIAQKKGSRLTVLHMIGISEAILAKDETQEMEEARYYMNLVKERFSTFLDKEYLKDIEVTQIVQNYKIFNEINQVAEEQEIDLIVMG